MLWTILFTVTCNITPDRKIRESTYCTCKRRFNFVTILDCTLILQTRGSFLSFKIIIKHAKIHLTLSTPCLVTKGVFLLAHPDSDSHNPIFVSQFHLSESEMQFGSQESTPNSGFFGFNLNPYSDSPFLYPFHRAHMQCSLGIHHGVQRIELHRYKLSCCLSLCFCSTLTLTKKCRLNQVRH